MWETLLDEPWRRSDEEARYLRTSTCIDIIPIAGRDMRDQSGGPILLSVKLVHQKSKLGCYKGMPGSKWAIHAPETTWWIQASLALCQVSGYPAVKGSFAHVWVKSVSNPLSLLIAECQHSPFSPIVAKVAKDLQPSESSPVCDTYTSGVVSGERWLVICKDIQR